MRCPRGEPPEIIKNGKIHNGKQRYRCKNCGRQVVANPPNRRITEETKPIIASCPSYKHSSLLEAEQTSLVLAFSEDYFYPDNFLIFLILNEVNDG